jgi:hypothetical protein
MASYIGRRKFLAMLGGAVAWPLAARAQQGERVRRIGVLTDLPSDDSEVQVRNAAFLQGLQEQGWTIGRNLQIDFRWGNGRDVRRLREYAAELVALAPDVVLAVGTTSVTALQQAQRHRGCLYKSPIPSGPASLRTWQGQAATSRGSPCKSTASAQNGWNCSSRSHPASRAPRSCGIPLFPRVSAILPQSRRWRPCSSWT